MKVTREELIEMIENGKDVTKVDTSGITDMSGFFFDEHTFNQDIGGWDVSNVEDMSSMFYRANSFNQDISGWDVSSVDDMSNMFYGASVFNGDIGSWNVSKVQSMSGIFYDASLFNQDIGQWDVSSVVDMGSMFAGTESFNQDIGDWNVSSVENMKYMFLGAEQFNQNISKWDTSSVESMDSMFSGAKSFNQDIGKWDTSSVESMDSMFLGAKSFNQDISKWDVSSVENMNGMFARAKSFSQDIASWDISDTTTRFGMFGAEKLADSRSGDELELREMLLQSKDARQISIQLIEARQQGFSICMIADVLELNQTTVTVMQYYTPIELKYSVDEIVNYNFLAAWKTDDKEWMKARKKEWLKIKSKFNQFIHFEKKNLKFVRNYFLTGLTGDTWLTEEGTQSLKTFNQPQSIDSYFNNIGLLVAFWLSPDHSKENWERIKCVYCYDLLKKEDKVMPIMYKNYHGACLGFRRMCEQYEQVEILFEYINKKPVYDCKFTPHKDCDSIFGDRLDLFFLKELKIELEENGQPQYGSVNQFHYKSLLSILQGYLSGTDFNPNNPVKYFIKEYIQWGLPKEEYSDVPFFDTLPKVVAFCWNVIDTPENRHPTQLAVAQELKEEILKVKDSLDEGTQKMIERGIDIFESGRLEECFLENQDKEFMEQPYYKFIYKHFGLTFW